MNTNPFFLLCLCISPWCYQLFLVASGSSSEVEDEGDAHTLELLTAHLVLDRSLVTMSLDTDLRSHEIWSITKDEIYVFY